MSGGPLAWMCARVGTGHACRSMRHAVDAHCVILPPVENMAGPGMRAL